jgi:hypothetical protein
MCCNTPGRPQSAIYAYIFHGCADVNHRREALQKAREFGEITLGDPFADYYKTTKTSPSKPPAPASATEFRLVVPCRRFTSSAVEQGLKPYVLWLRRCGQCIGDVRGTGSMGYEAQKPPLMGVCRDVLSEVVAEMKDVGFKKWVAQTTGRVKQENKVLLRLLRRFPKGVHRGGVVMYELLRRSAFPYHDLPKIRPATIDRLRHCWETQQPRPWTVHCLDIMCRESPEAFGLFYTLEKNSEFILGICISFFLLRSQTEANHMSEDIKLS